MEHVDVVAAPTRDDSAVLLLKCMEAYENNSKWYNICQANWNLYRLHLLTTLTLSIYNENCPINDPCFMGYMNALP